LGTFCRNMGKYRETYIKTQKKQLHTTSIRAHNLPDRLRRSSKREYCTADSFLVFGRHELEGAFGLIVCTYSMLQKASETCRKRRGPFSRRPGGGEEIIHNIQRIKTTLVKATAVA
jgi:hypothetical protein